MIKKNTFQDRKKILFLFFFLFTLLVNAQIGIGTVTPNVSSILDVSSTTKGLLAPRMTTVQKNAVTTPADGLMVYDTDLKLFYYYSSGTSTWLPMLSTSSTRINFKRIKSTDVLATVLAAELVAGGGAKYLLNSNTLYEINGTVVFDFPVELNSAYFQGIDTNNDIVVRTSGNIFEGATGGTVKNLTLIASTGSVFNINADATKYLTFRDCIVANSSSVGTLSGFGLVFGSIIQFVGNTTGITYNNINQLLLSNMGWFGSNSGTYEKFTGTFSLIEKQGGFTIVDGSAIGLDVSTAGLTITGDGVLESVVFTGTNTAGYVKPYTVGSYPGYNFNNSWTVRAAGIPTEGDSNAVGDFSMDYPVGSGASTGFNTSNPSNIVKVNGVSSSTNLFRFALDAPTNNNNRLRYTGKKKRIFQVSGSISFQVPALGTYIIYIAKNGTALTQFKIYGRGLALNDIVVLPLNASVELASNDYIEVFAQRYTAGITDAIIVPNMTITIK